MTVSGLPLRDRFDLYVNPEPNSGCHLWSGAIDPWGYGALNVKGVTAKAHRLAYEFECGEIPKGLSVLHKCDVRVCVNPQHLFLGTRADNMRDMWAKGRGKGSPKGSKAHAAKLSESDVLAIRSSDERQFLLAKQYGVDATTIRAIRRRRTWTHI